MIAGNNDTRTTTHKVVLPFYIYAALSFLAAAILLFTSSQVTGHYFQPHTLAITHAMTLGWGTMIILGTSHQLLPVLIEGKLYSNTLAYLSFAFAAVGIPLLVYAFYTFNMRWPAQYGAMLINAAIVCYLINVSASIAKCKHENVQSVFVFTAAIWLFITTAIGALLVYNFTYNILPRDSLHYLSLHAHAGIAGWFLLLVTGVGSRLIPMFLISKYDNKKLLWRIYALINLGLIAFVLLFVYSAKPVFYLFSALFIAAGLSLFVFYCYKAHQQRIRKRVDGQMKISLLSVLMMIAPLICLLLIVLLLLLSSVNGSLILAYGFSIFFGWLTAIILGMTFKTLPFIVWNKVYHAKAGLGKTPSPGDLFSKKIFNGMAISYVVGFGCFLIGILSADDIAIKTGAILLFCCAFLYNLNVFKILFHKQNSK
ncbi:cytochrome C oxidase subunit I [Panacibacter ginsenosidivorans]|uniref:Cytochrome C oxidase subunit I n=1 Tax=Panacibacter ginsenosidivorans TaxID=1813871 RepID=A0A5B8VCF0_9BACT|nr:cytochrome C oxidase subunit I [Panacibacter ginsenosidivorans]QEC69207.1 cytochrome C oxidase subunit I [Panacibacter ginsenosidivorans]